MAQNWFVIRGNNEQGPLTAQRLKEMAANGQLRPTDKVRREDMERPKQASEVKGLFPPPTEAAPPPDTSNSAEASSATGTPLWENVTLIAASVVFCFPVGLLLVWRHPNWSRPVKWAWTGAVGLIFVALFAMGLVIRLADRNALTQADAQWLSGDKAGAVAKYRPMLDRLGRTETALAYGRCIDFEFETGNGEAARKLLSEANQKGVVPDVNHPEAKALVAALAQQPVRPSGGSDKKDDSGDTLTADYWPHKPGTRQQTVGVLQFGKASAQFRKEYSYEPGGTLMVRWMENFIPQGQELSLPKPVRMQYRLQGGHFEIGEDNEVAKQIVWRPFVKIGAKAGDSWEREIMPGLKETYTLTKFGDPKWGPKEVDWRGTGTKETVYAAHIEVRTTTDIGGGSVPPNVEEIELGRGIGPVSRRSFREENGKREMNWRETLRFPVRK
ncbi:MAG TPA: DUF4339 domain-containing protein [Gemmatales bacterium]|nr:DUF4339 domain-containing protein [Gemmatales bacterium]